MKLLIVTLVSEHEKGVLELLNKSQIERFSGSGIEGFKDAASFMMSSSWFPSQKGGAASKMFFAFTKEEKIDAFFALAKEFNKNVETNNPIHAAVVPIERFM